MSDRQPPSADKREYEPAPYMGPIWWAVVALVPLSITSDLMLYFEAPASFADTLLGIYLVKYLLAGLVFFIRLLAMWIQRRIASR